MWDQLTPADIQRARDRLAALRAVTLNRHAEETKRLDIEQAEIEAFERLAAAFAQRYSNSAVASQPTTEGQSAVVVVADKDASEPARSEVPWASPSPDLPVHHHASPNFGTPPRLRRFVQ